MSSAPIGRGARERRARTAGSWTWRVLVVALAGVLGWFVTYMSAATLSANQSDGSGWAVGYAVYLVPPGIVVAVLGWTAIRTAPGRARTVHTRRGGWALTTALGLLAYLPVLVAGYRRDDQHGPDLPVVLVALGLAGVLAATLSPVLLAQPARAAGWVASVGAVGLLWLVFALVAGTHVTP